jgi:beta-phosphoglucomutase
MTSALQAIVFDFDGVIANSEPLHLHAFQQTLGEDGLDLSADDYYTRYLGYDDVGLFQALARDRQVALNDGQIEALVVRKASALQRLLRDGHVLFPGASAFIRAASTEVPLGIASGALRHEIVGILEGAGIADLFAVIVAAGDTLQSKPSPAPYLLAFEQLRHRTGRDLDPARSVAIEDSRWGLESARAAGLRCVGVTTSYRAVELEAAELVVGGLDELSVPVLDRLCASTRHVDLRSQSAQGSR